MSLNSHRWELREEVLDNDEYRRWSRLCRACGDRVTAFRSTAIYQFGRDLERLPHAVPLANWASYSRCGAPPAAALGETAQVYAAARHPRRALKTIEPESQVSQLIDRVLEVKGWTVERLAEELRVDPTQIRRWRNGRQPSGFATLRLARIALLSRDTAAIRPLLRAHRRR